MTKKVLETLLEYSNSVNIAELLDEDRLLKIAREVQKGYDEDLLSLQDHLDTCDRIVELTRLEREEKHYPIRNASNVKLPIITTAGMQFSSRTLPELIKGDELAKTKTIGNDPDGRKAARGRRVASHMNHQMLNQMDNTLDELDKLLMETAILGSGHTKTYFEPKIGGNKIEYIPYDEFVINAFAKNLEEAERKTHRIFLSEKEVIENQRFGIYSHLKEPVLEIDDEFNQVERFEGFMDKDSPDPTNVQELLEQHCVLDLDLDGYPEPYIVTIHEKSKQVLRIAPRFTPRSVVVTYEGEDQLLEELIDENGELNEDLSDDCEIKVIHAIEFFTDYHLMHLPGGAYHGIGLGGLLLDLNETSNTVSNQLLDAGRLANLKGGFMGSRLRIRGDTVDLEPGEWLKMEAADGEDLRKNIVPLDYGEPSTVLFQLLGFLINTSEKLSSSTAALTGTQDATNVSPHVMLSLIQQGMQVYLAFQRRILRGYKKNFTKLVELNKMYIDPQEYLQVIDPSEEELKEILGPNGELLDYMLVGDDVVPVADLKASTEAERLARVNVLLQHSQQLLQLGAINPAEITKELVLALDYANPERFMPPPQDPRQDPEIVKLEAELDEKERKLNMQEQELKLKLLEAEAKIKELESKAIKNLADAEAAEAGQQLAEYKAAADALLQQQAAMQQEQKNVIELAKLGQQAAAQQKQSVNGQERELRDEQDQAAAEQEPAE